MEEPKWIGLRLERDSPFFRFGPAERYESILEGGRDILTDAKELTFVWRETNFYPEFRRIYTSEYKWTLGNVVSHMYKLIDEYLDYHDEDSDLFIDRSIASLHHYESKNEIHIADES
uniref:Uncharacterized protein n=1 Tax=Marseillevirus LCMAC101 TaxID=2506602 RepID=A0A481YT25_9VIRU|nr:MAG: hypothetical protein LCMAC101_07120 [Marseillevirus LCMAC101]